MVAQLWSLHLGGVNIPLVQADILQWPIVQCSSFSELKRLLTCRSGSLLAAWDDHLQTFQESLLRLMSSDQRTMTSILCYHAERVMMPLTWCICIKSDSNDIHWGFDIQYCVKKPKRIYTVFLHYISYRIHALFHLH